MGTPTPKGAGVEAGLPRIPRVAMGVPGDTMGVPGDTMDVPGVAMDDPKVAMGIPVGGPSVGASPRVSRGGEASDGASP